MGAFDYNESMAQVRRESKTEKRVRSMDAIDIVKEIHGLEDEITGLQHDIERHLSIAADDLNRIAALEKVAEAAGAMAQNGVCSGYTDFYDALRAAGYLKE